MWAMCVRQKTLTVYTVIACVTHSLYTHVYYIQYSFEVCDKCLHDLSPVINDHRLIDCVLWSLFLCLHLSSHIAFFSLPPNHLHKRQKVLLWMFLLLLLYLHINCYNVFHNLWIKRFKIGKYEPCTFILWETPECRPFLQPCEYTLYTDVSYCHTYLLSYPILILQWNCIIYYYTHFCPKKKWGCQRI